MSNNLLQLIKTNAKVAIDSLVVVALLAIGTSVKEKLRFIWHSDHHFEMTFEKFRSMQDNKDGDQLYVIMENEVSGEVKYIVDILEDSEGTKWAYIYDIWIYYPVLKDQHGRIYIDIEHEGNKYLFLK